MPGFDRTGPRGLGPMTGGGRGLCGTPFARRWPMYRRAAVNVPYGAPWPAPYYGTAPFAPAVPLDKELTALKSDAEAIREELNHIEARIRELEKHEKAPEE